MESLQKNLVCPLCGKIVKYQHILEYHEVYWVYKGLYKNFPTTVEEFNRRFGSMGFYIKEGA